MVSLVKTTRNLIGGAIGALVGWMIVEPWPWLTTDPGPGQPERVASMAALAVLGLIVGATMGTGLGVAEGLNSGSPKQLVRSTLVGLLVGACGGLVGVYLGQMVYAAITGGRSIGGGGLLSFASNLVGRTLGWAMWGVIIGAGQGLASGSARRMSLGAVGGVIGGALGGFAFEVIGSILGSVITGEALRLIGFVAIGAGIGLFSSLAQEMFKQAWVRVLVGRGEGREIQIAKPVTVIGRDELADVPLFGDPQISKQHVLIQQTGNAYQAVAAQQGLAFAVNGQMVANSPLKDGDLIRVGSRELEFHEKASRGRLPAGAPTYAGTQMDAPMSGMPEVQLPPGVCQFCGQIRDAQGNCACTVAAGAPAPVAQQTQAMPTGEPTQVYGAQAAVRSLQVVAGPLTGRVINLGEGQSAGVGRAPEADIPLQGDTFASRQHARFAVTGGQLVVEDQGSTNGTTVNGARVGTAVLNAGDVVAIGQTQFRVS